ncbi:MAG: hypothetical protein UX13_C0033G0005 [Candidatus Woesebacteria bacterium GW2011_GWB1_45_5]|uniref:Uncharacterized protein n=1 Tax=Candidatus Woesebacteria bacterium GW2011_GWB1_45_5 TaxID=1618581 RepID=A0A0G1QM33_9BACT|nr:MAG: hypothetical protein UX13_C0033G0005 [Candidatus Woesebacteria bacterium GW2011_GWB1_45_5]
MSYNVVFEGTGEENSNTKGVRTWTSFKSREEFENFLLRGKNGDKVIAEGATREEAISMARETGVEDLVIAAVEGSITPEGRINREVLDMKLSTLKMVLGRRGKEGDSPLQNLLDSKNE